MKRSRLNPMSKRRRAALPARRDCVAEVIARDKVCQFVPHLRAHLQGIPSDVATHLLWNGRHIPLTCWGSLDVHEPGHRSQGADPTHPEQCVAICRLHHDVVHNEPLLAKALHL